MKYRLQFDNIDVATVTEEDSDFPTFFGTYNLVTGIDRVAQLRVVLKYLEYSVRTWPLIEADRIDEINFQEESNYINVIETEKWALVAEAGERIPILVPIFRTDNGINWRLNPQRPPNQAL